MSFVQSHWPKIAGAASLAIALIGRAGDIDFIISRIRDPDWVGTVIALTTSMPGWLTASLVLLGFALIIWDVLFRGQLRGDIDRFRVLTQDEYDSIAAPDERTMYAIVAEKPEGLKKESKFVKTIKGVVAETRLVLFTFAMASAIIIILSLVVGAVLAYLVIGS